MQIESSRRKTGKKVKHISTYADYIKRYSNPLTTVKQLRFQKDSQRQF